MTISRRRLKKQRKIHLKRPVKIKSRFTTKESHGVTPLVKKYWAQRYNLFSSRYDQGIRLDEEGWFSVTPEEIAVHHAQRSGGGVVIDCFAGIGGNAIQFSTVCQHVVAIDIDPEKVALAFNNANIYGVEDYIDFVVGDFFQLAPSLKMEEISRILSDELHKRVVIVDTSNEIGGGGNIPHPAIGGALRLQVPEPSMQHRVMIEAVENHMPEVIVIDEIGTQAEVQACHSIAERGVMLIGTAHGEQLENIINNPSLSDLIGGVETVTIGNREARNRNSRKSIRESMSLTFWENERQSYLRHAVSNIFLKL